MAVTRGDLAYCAGYRAEHILNLIGMLGRHGIEFRGHLGKTDIEKKARSEPAD